MTDHVTPANSSISLPPYTEVDGHGHVSIMVQFSQQKADEPPVDLRVAFAFDAAGTMSARCYVNPEDRAWPRKRPNPLEVSGAGTWHGNPLNVSSYVARLPVLGPFMQVFVCNRAALPRKVSVWVYLTP
jgi:hypothetical protein